MRARLAEACHPFTKFDLGEEPLQKVEEWHDDMTSQGNFYEGIAVMRSLHVEFLGDTVMLNWPHKPRQNAPGVSNYILES